MGKTATQFTCEPMPLSEWESLRPIFNEEFDSALPHHDRGAVIAIKDGQEIIGFVSLESLLLVSLAYLKPEYRHTKARRVLFDHIEEKMRNLKDRSVLIITETDKASRLMKRYGMTERGQAWRLDL